MMQESGPEAASNGPAVQNGSADGGGPREGRTKSATPSVEVTAADLLQFQQHQVPRESRSQEAAASNGTMAFRPPRPQPPPSSKRTPHSCLFEGVHKKKKHNICVSATSGREANGQAPPPGAGASRGARQRVGGRGVEKISASRAI
ncbi:Forkhead box protein P1-B [Liparis tanakae]|uniref:Forkhead box protein P1-B n=1 Tax=Liparis tanakae TaxID=230148 RepID=A0A4Z2H2P9_9TELE|nr:Forkhead box protein P1-B [Liparis tanakae]